MGHLIFFEDKIIFSNLIDTHNDLIEQAKQTKQYIEKYLEYRNQIKRSIFTLLYQDGDFILDSEYEMKRKPFLDTTEYVIAVKPFDKLIDLINLMKGDDDKCLKAIQKNKFNL
jgi:hypothetical protein